MSEQTSTAVLDHVIGTLRETALHTDPWPHGYIGEALPASTAADIESTFDRVRLATVSGSNREKTYRMNTRRVDLDADPELPSPAWQHLVDALRHERYRTALAELTGTELGGTQLTLDLWEYQEGDWLAPHVDKPEKVVTQLFYFSRGWQPTSGGRLLVLDGPDSADEPRERLSPVTGSSAVLVRSDISWHAVEESAGAGASRCSVAATFWSAMPGVAS